MSIADEVSQTPRLARGVLGTLQRPRFGGETLVAGGIFVSYTPGSNRLTASIMTAAANSPPEMT